MFRHHLCVTRSLTTIAALVLVFGLAGCGDEEKPTGASSTTAAAQGKETTAGKDTTAGCVAAFKKLITEESSDPDTLSDEPPPECDDLSTQEQQAAVSEAVKSAFDDLGEDFKKDLQELNTPTP
jgi:hypothetical protein